MGVSLLYWRGNIAVRAGRCPQFGVVAHPGPCRNHNLLRGLLPPALLTVGGAACRRCPIGTRCRYDATTLRGGTAACLLTQSSPHWPRAGHPWKDIAVSLPERFGCRCQGRNGGEIGTSPSWPRAGHPCKDITVSLPAGSFLLMPLPHSGRHLCCCGAPVWAAQQWLYCNSVLPLPANRSTSFCCACRWRRHNVTDLLA